jgi:hypothetical protein
MMKCCMLHGFLASATLSIVCPTVFAEFVRPQKPGDPLIYGVRNGIFVALHPSSLDARPQGGPRGLVRVGYEANGRRYLINFIAVKPIVASTPGFSELEKGSDGSPGRRFWVGDGLRDGGIGETGNVCGSVEQTPAGDVLSFVIHVETYANGARPVVEISLFENAPDRIRLRSFSGPGGAPMEQCVLSATMGNQSRCRWLWLRTSAIYAPDVYRDYAGTDFVEKGQYGLAYLHQTRAEDVVAAITPDEFEPREVWPLPGGRWHHEGKWMSQFWLKRRGQYNRSLQCHVNGRRVYWAGNVPIPGGTAFENFDFQEDFVPGQEVWFGYTSESPAKLFAFPYDVSPSRVNGRRKLSKEETAVERKGAETQRSLVNGNFVAGLNGWRLRGGARLFRRFGGAGGMGLTTFGENGDADTGRISQCFQVPIDADELRFNLSGGSDARRTYVALWHGAKLWRWMTARNDNTPFQVRWDVSSLRGEAVTLEVVDESINPWGFIGVQEFAIGSRK